MWFFKKFENFFTKKIKKFYKNFWNLKNLDSELNQLRSPS